MIKQSIKEGTIIDEFGELNYVVAGHPLNIYNPNFEWDQEANKSYEDVRNQFFIQHNQVALLSNRLNHIFGRLKDNIGSSSGRS